LEVTPPMKYGGPGMRKVRSLDHFANLVSTATTLNEVTQGRIIRNPINLTGLTPRGPPRPIIVP